MKNIVRLFLVLVLSLSFLSEINASWLSDFLDQDNYEIPIDDCGWNCDSISDGTNLVKYEINDIEKDRTFSQFVQDILIYLLWFLSLIAIIYIIYAWFMILIWAWDEEKLKKSKTTILYVVIWMVLIWLAYPITLFIINVLNIN